MLDALLFVGSINWPPAVALNPLEWKRTKQLSSQPKAILPDSTELLK
jgi:hypothetical protein